MDLVDQPADQLDVARPRATRGLQPGEFVLKASNITLHNRTMESLRGGCF